ncbi:restriction endonuclease subunit S [Microbacterium azadirachtae]|uniref:restriction endonuclease subunit S n=1 Tax=Microbacterium azadirachtae TaxID=582680 RepID=UPI0006991CC5|nr:restriction endonuclease subunit S [Microbacterium azadirachtae]
MIPKSSRDDNYNKPSEDMSKYQRVSAGDLVVNKMKAWQGSLGISAYDGIVSPAYFVFKATGHIDPRFGHYLLRSSEYAAHMAAISSGIRPNQWDLDPMQFAATPLLVPPSTQQRAIADYLDRETAQIDAFIAKNEQLIALLTERRVSSMVEAIGLHDTIPLKRLVQPTRPLTYGILQCGAPVEDGVPYIGPSDLPGEGESPDLSSLRRTTHEIASAYGRSVLTGGDIVVSIGPAFGRVGLISDDLSGANLTQDTVRVATVPGKIDANYLVWVLSSRIADDFWDYQILGATFRRLNLGTLGETPIPYPPLADQMRIADEVAQVVARIDDAIGVAQRTIELARERRVALISAAVTGKVDVGDAA